MVRGPVAACSSTGNCSPGRYTSRELGKTTRARGASFRQASSSVSCPRPFTSRSSRGEVLLTVAPERPARLKTTSMSLTADSTATSSRMSALMNSTRSKSRRAAGEGEGQERLRTRSEARDLNRASTRFRPMNPVPPVTRTRRPE